MYYAQITNGVVTAVTQTAGPIDAPHMIPIDGLLDIAGHSYNPATGTFSPPPVVNIIPQVLTMRQARLVLNQVGLLDDVEAAVQAAERSVQIEWEYATEVRRDWQTLITLAQALNLDEAALNNLFEQGSKL